MLTHFTAADLSAQVKQSGNVFAVFTPVAWPADSPGFIADPSRRTCIVSLGNKLGRPFRLKLKAGEERYAVSRFGSDGPVFGGGFDIALMSQGQSSCSPFSFELDAEAESKAGLPPLPFVYDKTLLSGVPSFTPAEIECYTLDA